MRAGRLLYIVACAIAAVMPLLAAPSEQLSGAASESVFYGWPDRFEGKTLTELPLTGLEQRFATDFPGRIGRFTDGQREIVIRWVTQATRKLHPASDCFQGIGYSVKPLALHRDKHGSLWSSFAAKKGDERLRVYERIHDNSGETWTDVSAWYWSAIRTDHGSWWSITVAEKAQ